MRGYTLVETVIVIALAALMFLVLTSFFYGWNSLYEYQAARVATAGSAGEVIRRTGSLVRAADQVLASHSFSDATYASGSTTLVLALPSIAEDGATIGGAFDYAVVYATGTKVVLQVAPSAASSRAALTRQLTEHLFSLVFTYDDTSFPAVSKVGIDLVTRAMAKEQELASHRYEQVYLRN